MFGLFTRPFSAPDIPTIEKGNIPLIWYIGPNPNSGTELTRHDSRGSASVKLAASGSGNSSTPGSDVDSRRNSFQAHGALMGISHQQRCCL